MKRTVFLSYAREDVKIMEEIRTFLETEDITVWTDQNITVGEMWVSAIGRQISRSDAFIVTMSPSANESEWVMKEVLHADENSIAIFPLLAKGSNKKDIPLNLRGLQYIDIRSNFSEGLHKLLRTLKNHFSSLDEQKPVLKQSDFFDLKNSKMTSYVAKIPILGQISAGSLVNSPSDEKTSDHIEIPLSSLGRVNPENVFALKVSGDSMIDANVADGDIIFLSRQGIENTQNGDMVAIRQISKDETTLKYFFREGSKARLQPANPHYKATYIDLSDCQIQGKLISLFRNP